MQRNFVLARALDDRDYGGTHVVGHMTLFDLDALEGKFRSCMDAFQHFQKILLALCLVDGLVLKRECHAPFNQL